MLLLIIWNTFTKILLIKNNIVCLIPREIEERNEDNFSTYCFIKKN